MKLLLTSAGFTNKSISDALLKLACRPFSRLKLAFIPTAANVETGGKEWLITDLHNCLKLSFAQVDIVDISAVPKEIWLPRLEETDILFFGGGNTFHLMNWVIKSGLKNLLPKMLQTKIYVGLSAGSQLACLWNSNKQDTYFYAEPPEKTDRYDCLKFANFLVMPHLNSSDFPRVNLTEIAKYFKDFNEQIYALDDNSAIMVDVDKLTVVSQGKWRKFN